MTSPYTLDFERDVLAFSLQDTEYLRHAAPILGAHHFSDPEYGWVWKVAVEYWTEFAERPGIKILASRADRDFVKDKTKLESHKQILVDLFRRKTVTPKSALEELRQFSRDHNLYVAMEESLRLRDRGDTDGAISAMRKMVAEDISPSSNTVVDWIENFDERQRLRKHRKEHPEDYPVVTTGLPTLDADLGGGVRPGEVNLIVGTTGRGKSIFLNHLGYAAISNKRNVLHVTLEMSVEQVATRYDSRFTGKAHGKFKGWDFAPGELAEVKAKVDRNRKRLASKLRILSMPLTGCNIEALRAAVVETRMAMPEIDLLLIDSADHMRGTGRFESKRLEQAQIYWDLKALADEQKFAVWTSTQAGKEWEKRIATASAVSESYDKARIADLVVTLNEPELRRRGVVKLDEDEEPEEDDELEKSEKAGDLSLYVAKNRDGPGGKTIPLDTDFNRMKIEESTGAKRAV